jgi:ketosteroid isomerase-like protein
MPGEGSTGDPVELTRQAFEAASCHDLDALIGFYSAEAILDLSAAGIGTFEGVAAVRAIVEDWWGTWEEHLSELEQIVHLGHGVVVTTVREDGRLVGSDRHVEQRLAYVFLWVDGKILQNAGYLDVDHARAVAERLAEDSNRDTASPGGER